MSSSSFIFYIHGGAYEIGNPGTHMLFMRHLSYRTQCRVFGAKYITDKGIDRMHNKLKNALEEALKSNLDPIFAGDSAGGGLVLTFLQYMNTNYSNVKTPHKNVLISPWVDLNFFNKEIPYDMTKKDKDFLPLSMVHRFANRLCTNVNCEASAKNLLNNDKYIWPLTFVVVGEDEVLGKSIRDTFSNKANFVVKTYPKMKHVFPVLASFIERTAFDALGDIAKFVRDDMVHINAKVFSFVGEKYNNLQCVCKMKLCEKDRDCNAVVCDKYLIFQKHDSFKDGFYQWFDKNGMFYIYLV